MHLVWHTKIINSTINNPWRSTKKPMNDESKQHDAVVRIQSEQQICESTSVG